MKPINRRDVLRAGGLTASGMLAGCSSIVSGSSSEIRIGGISVINYHSKPHWAHVLVVEDGEPVFWRSKRLASEYSGKDTGGLLDGVPEEPGEYVFYIRLDEREQRKRWDLREEEPDCLSLTANIGTPVKKKEGRAEIELFKSLDCTPVGSS